MYLTCLITVLKADLNVKHFRKSWNKWKELRNIRVYLRKIHRLKISRWCVTLQYHILPVENPQVKNNSLSCPFKYQFTWMTSVYCDLEYYLVYPRVNCRNTKIQNVVNKITCIQNLMHSFFFVRRDESLENYYHSPGVGVVVVVVVVVVVRRQNL